MSRFGDSLMLSSSERVVGNPNRMLPSSQRTPLANLTEKQSAMIEDCRSPRHPLAKSLPFPAILPPVAPSILDSENLFDSRSTMRENSFRAPEAVDLDRSVSDSLVQSWIHDNSSHFSSSLFPRPRSAASMPPFPSATAASYHSPSLAPSTPPSIAPSIAASMASSMAHTAPPSYFHSSLNSAVELRLRRNPRNEDDAASVSTYHSSASRGAAPSFASIVDDTDEPMELDDSGSVLQTSKQLGTSNFDSISDESSTSHEDSRVLSRQVAPAKTRSLKNYTCSDPFLRKESGIVGKAVFFFLRFIRFLLFSALRLLKIVTFCVVATLIVAFTVYVAVYVFSNYSAPASSEPLVDVDAVAFSLHEKVHGQSVGVDRIIDELDSFLRSDENRRLLSLHGSTGVGKSHVINLLKENLPANSLHVLFPDLVVHDLENPDADRTPPLRRWLAARVQKETPFKVIVVENADANLLLMDDVAGALKAALDERDAIWRRELAVRRAASPMEAIDGWIDWVFGISKDVDERRDKVLVIVVSSVGFRHINAAAYHGRGEAAEAVEVVALESVARHEVAFLTTLTRSGMTPRLVVFFPLERDSLRFCLLRELVDVAGTDLEQTVEKLLNKAELFPPKDPIYSASGCKRIASLHF